ncbi:MAG: hypothetical protein AAB877_03710 [Patescibacteria group bacterium]
MNNRKFLYSLLSIALILPNISLAISFPPEPSGKPVNIPGVISGIVTIVWWVFVGVSVIMFIVAGIQFMAAQGEPGKITQARNSVIWGAIGIIAAVIGFSVTAIIRNWFG